MSVIRPGRGESQGHVAGTARSAEAGAGRRRPYLFLSYAHMPAPIGGRRRTDPNLWIAQLFKDSSHHIRRWRDPAPGEKRGFMDRELQHGDEWPGGCRRDLAVCKVFVPLYSRHYFLSEHCGREWHAFYGRVRNSAQGAGHVQPIIPGAMDSGARGQLPARRARSSSSRPSSAPPTPSTASTG